MFLIFIPGVPIRELTPVWSRSFFLFYFVAIVYQLYTERIYVLTQNDNLWMNFSDWGSYSWVQQKYRELSNVLARVWE